MSAAKEVSDADEADHVDLSDEERRSVDERKSAPARVVHEIVRQQGIEELERPIASLFWSGIAAGVSICTSVLAEASLRISLPAGPWREPVSRLGYSVGFIIVILGRLQLFTESTVTAVIPLATKPSLASLWRTLRLWAAVCSANLIGTFLFALFVHVGGLGVDALPGAMLEVSRKILGHDVAHNFLAGIPAGFLIATVVWMLPSAEGAKLWVIGLLTSLITLGGFSHVIAGSSEAWLLMLSGEMTGGQAIGGYILPALGGNIVGGTGLFALLAHAQVRQEL